MRADLTKFRKAVNPRHVDTDELDAVLAFLERNKKPLTFINIQNAFVSLRLGDNAIKDLTQAWAEFDPNFKGLNDRGAEA